MRHFRLLMFCILAFALISITKTLLYNYDIALANQIDFNSLPVKGMVTMIDLGATECIPCKMMAPVMKKVEADYQGKAAIVFIDVWKNREQAPKYNIKAIPTQIFYNASGTEVYRHEGFMSEKDIVAQLTKMGITPPSSKTD